MRKQAESSLQNDRVLLIHYDEIGLKGENRARFEEQLQRNVKELLGEHLKSVRREYGYLLAEPREEADLEVLRRRLELLPGVANFSFAVTVPLDLEALKQAAVQVARSARYETFKIHARRPNKLFPYTSMEINAELGAAVLEQVGGKVRLVDPDLTIHVEIGFQQAYVHAMRHRGVGGLPVGTAGKVVTLLSGGIDSPVAAYLMMRRGAKVTVVHFQNETQVTAEVRDKVRDLTAVLARYQGPTKLYMVPFADLQMALIATVPARLRMVVYRRFMLRIATRVARREKAKALVVGDNLSQVASQTLDNLRVAYQATDMTVLAPLIGFNKTETVEWAKKIDTFDISIRPYGDCCTFLVPKHPETHAKPRMVEQAEAALDVDALVKAAYDIAEREVIQPSPLE